MNNYLMIQDNVVTNMCVWDGDTQTWTPPANAMMLVQETTPAKIWNWNDAEWVLVEELGQACIGFTWDGTACITNQPKPTSPPPDQPASNGTQTL